MLKSDIYIAHILCAIVGISAWIEVNGLFSELAHMKDIPEGWSIASIMVVIVQMGNIAPLVYYLLPKKPKLPISMVIVLAMGISSLIFLAITWPYTHTVAGTERSTMIYIGTLMAASADCLSNLVFWPYVGQFPHSYITAMGTGESLSSAVSAIVSSIQKGMEFGPTTFFLILTVLVVICSVAFGVFEYKYAKTLAHEARERTSKELEVSMTESGVDTTVSFSSDEVSAITFRSVWGPNWSIFVTIMGIAFVQNALNHSLLPFACRSYKDARWLSQTALFVASPIASISASFFQPKTSIYPAVAVWVATSIFLIIAAALSDPIFPDQSVGVGMMAFVAILSGASLAYSKVSAMLWLRSRNGPRNVNHKEYMRRVMTAAGISMQIGSVVGAVIMFSLVNIANVFPN
jgi:riboflavin transporter 2